MGGLAWLATATAFAACSFPGHEALDPDARPDPDAAVDAAWCPTPFTLSDVGCHAMPSATGLGPMTWSAARGACQALGGDLPIIDSVSESMAVASLLPATNRVWLGLTGAGNDGSTWQWLDGQTVATHGLSLWRSGQPTVSSDCAVVRPDTAEWAGRRCTDAMLVVCEKQP